MASVLALGSCVNEVKNTPLTKDTLPGLSIIYSIPDSSNILSVNFRASVPGSLSKKYCLDWNFGDSSALFQQFDSVPFNHLFKNFGTYIVSLTAIDTATKTILGRVNDTIILRDNRIDTNYLHLFTKARMEFYSLVYDTLNPSNAGGSVVIDTINFLNLGQEIYEWIYPFGQYDPGPNYVQPTTKLVWDGYKFSLSGEGSWSWVENKGMYNEIGESGNASSDLSGQISLVGNRLDSVKYFSRYYAFHSGRADQREVSTSMAISLANLPNVTTNQDSIVFTATGNAMRSILKSLNASEGGYYNNYGGSAAVGPILWNTVPEPMIKVIFYK